MNLKLKSLHLENFKGAKDKTYTFGDLTRISGMNRLGKTTIATAWYWLLADKDYDLHSNPNIRPDDVEECIPTVTAVLDVDGREITIAKMQKRSVSKPNDKGISKVTLTNTYEINAVPKNERDFKAYLEDLGLAFDKFLVCSHPNVFTGQKTADMRNMLFKMASEKSDCDIAAMSAETTDVATLLSDYKYEEIEAMQKASKKKAVEQVEAIPNQIVGLEKAKVDIDVAEQELAKNDLERKIAEVDSKIEDAGKAVSDLKEEAMHLQFDMSAIMQTMGRELESKRRELENAKYEASKEFTDVHDKISSIEKQIAENNKLIELEEQKKPDINKRFKENMAKVFDETPYLFDESAWKYDEKDEFCKLCGQKLPEGDIEQKKADFERNKANAKADAEKKLSDAKEKFYTERNNIKDSINAEAEAVKNKINDLNADISKKQAEIDDLKKKEQAVFAKQNEISKQLEELPAEADYSQNEEYAKLKARHDAVKVEIAKADSLGHDELMTQFEAEKEELQAELDAVKEKIAQAANNVRIDERIAELQEKQRDYEQAKADAEKILYQLKLVSEKKNELLVEEINNHFGIVRWLLFEHQKNGEYKETCKAYIIADDGTKKYLGESMNTGREIEAKLDICNSFQKFFGMQLPIFLDGAESLNDCYMPKLDCQLITLNVTEDKELKVEVV